MGNDRSIEPASFEAATLEQMRHWVDIGGGAEGMRGGADLWGSENKAMADLAERVKAKLKKANVAIESRSGDAMQGALAPVVQWTEVTAESATVQAEKMKTHGEAFDQVKNSIPAKSEEQAAPDSNFFKDSFDNMFNGGTDAETAKAANERLRQEAIRAFGSYGSTSASTVQASAVFTAPPDGGMDTAINDGSHTPVGQMRTPPPLSNSTETPVGSSSSWAPAGSTSSGGSIGPGGSSGGSTPPSGGTGPGGYLPPSQTTPSHTPSPSDPVGRGPGQNGPGQTGPGRSRTTPVPGPDFVGTGGGSGAGGVGPGSGRQGAGGSAGGAGVRGGTGTGSGARGVSGGLGAGGQSGVGRGGAPGVGASSATQGSAGGSGARGAGGGAMGGAGSRGKGAQEAEEEEHYTPEFLKGDHGFFDDDLPKVAPPVFGDWDNK